MEKTKYIFFRNDDPDYFEKGDKTDEVQMLTNLFLEKEVQLIHAVVPKTVTLKTTDYFLGIKKDKPESLEIIQHGWAHKKYKRGEFDQSRSYKEQYNDIKLGKERMKEIFGDYFFPAFVFPYGVYTTYSIKILEELGFKVLSSHWNKKKLQNLYKICHIFKIGTVGKHHISYHGNDYARSRLLELSPCINILSDSQNKFKTPEQILREINICSKKTKIIGILLHHIMLTGNTRKKLNVLRELLTILHTMDDIQFVTFDKIIHMPEYRVFL